MPPSATAPHRPNFTTKLNLHTSRHFKVISSLSPNEISSPNAPPATATDLRIVFAAGGTGGHIYPAITIADELKTLNPTTQILFIGTQNHSIAPSNYNFTPIQASPLHRPLLSFQNLLFPFHLIKSTIHCYKLLRDFNPHIVFGTGGYVSAPACLCAGVVTDTRMVIQEQNSVPGLANRVLSLFADVVFVGFDSSVRYFPKRKCVASGNPIRLCMRRYVSKLVARLYFFPKARKSREGEVKVVLILGGSLGANAINVAVLGMCYQMILENKNWYVIWQTGAKGFKEMASLVKHHPRIVLTPFMHKMNLAYAAADLVVSRAGALTCSEILATGKPSILIPSPNVAEGHQLKNAIVMSDLAWSKVIVEEELDSATLRTAIEEILGDESRMADMSKKAMEAARPYASLDIAEHILSHFKLSTVEAR